MTLSVLNARQAPCEFHIAVVGLRYKSHPRSSPTDFTSETSLSHSHNRNNALLGETTSFQLVAFSFWRFVFLEMAQAKTPSFYNGWLPASKEVHKTFLKKVHGDIQVPYSSKVPHNPALSSRQPESVFNYSYQDLKKDNRTALLLAKKGIWEVK